jgi:hypothetical protein
MRGPAARGERSPHAKLTAAQVRAIRASTASGVVLARRYGVSRNRISLIRLRRAWMHVP